MCLGNLLCFYKFGSLVNNVHLLHWSCFALCRVDVVLQACSEGALGKYAGGVSGAAASEILFIKNHEY